MAGQRFDSKTFNPQAFGAYTETLPKEKLNALYKANIFKSNGDIKGAFSAQTGTAYAVLPMYGRLSGSAVNYDGTTAYGTAKKLNTYERGVVVFGRKDKFAESDFSYDITSGVDFMSQVASQVNDYMDDVNEEALVSIINGIFAMTGTEETKFVNAHTFDITSETDNKVGVTTLNNAIQKASGDRKAKYALVLMNSAIATSLENQKVLEYLKYTDANGIERQLNLASWNGKLVLVDDTYTYDSDNANYITYALGNGVFDFEDVGTKVPYAMDRDEDLDMDLLYVRERLCIAPYGISYVKANQSTLSPTNTELADGANWKLVNDQNGNVINHKEIAIAKIVSKG